MGKTKSEKKERANARLFCLKVKNSRNGGVRKHLHGVSALERKDNAIGTSFHNRKMRYLGKHSNQKIREIWSDCGVQEPTKNCRFLKKISKIAFR